MVKGGCINHNNHNHESIKIDGIYSTPVDLNTLVKPGKFKIKLGKNRPNLTQEGADALIRVNLYLKGLTQIVIVLSGCLAGKEFSRSSFDNGNTWTEYVSTSSVQDKLDRNFSQITEVDTLKDDDIFVIWSGNDNFSISASQFKNFVTGEHDKGYFPTVESLVSTEAKLGDFAIVGETTSFWIWDGNWKETSGVKSVTAEDILGFNKDTLVNIINNVVTALNTTNFMCYHYSGYTELGDTQDIPNIRINDSLLLVFGGIILKQNIDFIIPQDNKIKIIGINVRNNIPIHIFKVMQFNLPQLTDKNGD